MKYKEIKADDVSKLSFVRNIIIDGTTVKHVEITVDGKNYLLIGQWDSVKISEQEPDEVVDGWIVKGQIAGHDIVPKFYESEGSADGVIDKADCGLEKVRARYNKTQGCIIGEGVGLEIADRMAASQDDGIPF